MTFAVSLSEVLANVNVSVNKTLDIYIHTNTNVNEVGLMPPQLFMTTLGGPTETEERTAFFHFDLFKEFLFLPIFQLHFDRH